MVMLRIKKIIWLVLNMPLPRIYQSIHSQEDFDWPGSDQIVALLTIATSQVDGKWFQYSSWIWRVE